MRLNFCTLFNSNYLARGIALYRSLEEQCPDFHLYVFAFDAACEKFLRSQQYEKLTVIGLQEFEDSELLRVKPSRSAAEYCWTCTSSTVLYCIETYSLGHCTYLDADMIFYSDPSVLIAEMKDNDILLTEHRYTEAYHGLEESGRFCVQFVTFFNRENGMKALRWWREACLEWCYARVEDGKFGDQKYLDDWEARFNGVHVLQHRGGGVAPWNIQQFDLSKDNGKFFIREKKTGERFPIVFFHFHGVKFFADGIFQLCGPVYELEDDVKAQLYFPYVRRLNRVAAEIKEQGVTFDPNGASGKSPARPWNFAKLLFYYLAGVKASLKNISGATLAKTKRHYHFYFTNRFTR